MNSSNSEDFKLLISSSNYFLASELGLGSPWLLEVYSSLRSLLTYPIRSSLTDSERLFWFDIFIFTVENWKWGLSVRLAKTAKSERKSSSQSSVNSLTRIWINIPNSPTTMRKMIVLLTQEFRWPFRWIKELGRIRPKPPHSSALRNSELAETDLPETLTWLQTKHSTTWTVISIAKINCCSHSRIRRKWKQEEEKWDVAEKWSWHHHASRPSLEQWLS